MTGIGVGLLIMGAALFVAILVGVGLIVYDNDLANRRLMDACRHDHKEYECVAMLERGH